MEYAYPNNDYDDDTAHIVLQGLLAKSEFLYQILNNVETFNEEEKDFKSVYLGKITGLIELLNNGYDNQGNYKGNGHEIFSQLIGGLKVENKDIAEIKLTQNESVNIEKEDSHGQKIANIFNEEEKEEVKPIINEGIKTKLKV